MLVQRLGPAYPGCSAAPRQRGVRDRRFMVDCGMRARRRTRRHRGFALAVLTVTLATILLGACDTMPILRGAGSERRQNIGVGLPF